MADFAWVAAVAAAFVAAGTGHSHGGREIAERGNSFGAPACASCHGTRFQGDPSIGAPEIAGLPAGFIVQRLDRYAGAVGYGTAMNQVASDLSPTERREVAAYLSSLSEHR